MRRPSAPSPWLRGPLVPFTIGCSLVQHYGTTETWIVTVLRPEDHEIARPERLASCGVAVPLVQIRIADQQGGDVRQGTVGEVLVKSPTSFSGYLGQPEGHHGLLAVDDFQ
ncbi:MULTISPECIES: AMP-binding protein [Bradyrhizobium]|uniref:AMP-binding protein n=1 Tax=Bradyrhizobium TaxID=374 RepID=UPI0009B738E9